MGNLDLSGAWRLRWSDGQRGQPWQMDLEEVDEALWVDAQVPGEVHLEALAQGWIPDPYVGANCVLARWVEEYWWYYRKRFDAPPAALGGRAWLALEGLDLAASVRLNGEEVATHANFFRPCRVEVTGKLRPGPNLLTVHLEPCQATVADKPAEGWLSNPDQRLHKRHWLRKPQFQFLWDWSTRLVNMGIQRPVRLEWEPEGVPARWDRLVPLAEWDPGTGRGRVRARVFAVGLGTAPARVTLAARLPGLGASAEAELELAPGLHPLEVELAVEHPELWWPRGHGAQKLYALEAELRAGGRILGEARAEVGFRSVRMVEDPHPSGGFHCRLEINGKPIFAKGANLVPADMILARLDADRYAVLVERALEANFNLLRVWGGGVYESDAFYRLCDRAGVLVWQEFIFACGRYPTHDPAFLAEVKAEAVQQIRRLAGHPSLILWCGNNENEWASWDWGWEKGVAFPDYACYHMVLPRLLEAEDGTRPYRPSSPMSPDASHPNRDDRGDQHPWDVSFKTHDFRLYRELGSRFPNEGGMLGPTSLPTLRACLEGGPERIGSFAWQLHDNTVAGLKHPGLIDAMLKDWLGLDIKSLPVAEYCYRGGLLMGEALREYCDNFRRRMFDSAAAVFWMFNDCWPCTRSWSVVDYHLRRTPAFAYVKRAFAPLHLVLAEDGEGGDGGAVAVHGVNEGNVPVTASLRYGLFGMAGGYPLDRRAEVTLAPGASTRIASFPRSAWADPSATVAFAVLEAGGRVLARNRLILPRFRELAWSPPAIRVELRDGRAIFTCPVFALGICLDLDGEKALDDNFFDLYPDQPHSLEWDGGTVPKILWTGNLSD